VPGSGVIPYYAADGDFYEQAFFTFNADGSVSESMTLPLGGTVPVPDPLTVTATPEPPSAFLLGAGLLGLAGLRFSRRPHRGVQP
jgi:MYXO-CTERM domain-containing protein